MRELLDILGQQDNGELMLAGYSQGGHAAMSMHKYIEENNLLDEFNVIASCPGSGAYDMSGSQTNTLLSGEPYSNPGYLVYAFASFNMAYGNLYQNYSDILQSPYDDIVVPFFNGNNTTLSMADLNPLLPQLVTYLITPAQYNGFENDMNHPLRLALAANDVYDWTPQRTVRIYYCTWDEQVDYSNATTALNTMQANGAPDVSGINLGPFSHEVCIVPWITSTIDYFNSVRSYCQPTALNDYQLTDDISLFPNPVSDLLTVKSINPILSWKIYDSLGKLVFDSKNRNFAASPEQIEIDVTSLSNGLYQFIARDNTGKLSAAKFMKSF